MRYRALGSSGILVSAVGFGGWEIGGRTAGATSYGDTDDSVSQAALERAYDLGITLYDTANVYGNGHSEALIGATFRTRRDRVIIATKAGMLPSYAGADFAPQSLRASLEGSLRHLGTDYVDIFLLHNPPPAEIKARPEIVEEMVRLRSEGKVRALGFSAKSPAEARALIDTPHLACLQVNLNLLDWRAVENGLLEDAARLGVGIIARTPLAFGFLGGGLAEDQVFDAHDHRSTLSRNAIRNRVRAAETLLTAAADGDESSAAYVALRFCLSFPSVSSTIPGMMRPMEVETNAAAGDSEPFSEATMQRLEGAYRQCESSLGP